MHKIIMMKIDKPVGTGVVLGEMAFRNIHEEIEQTIVKRHPELKFGLAVCDLFRKCEVFSSGNDPGLIDLAAKNCTVLRAEHSFIVFVDDSRYLFSLDTILRYLPGVHPVYCATASATEVIMFEREKRRCLVATTDGYCPKSANDKGEAKWRRELLRYLRAPEAQVHRRGRAARKRKQSKN
jgi:adenosine/AMP kinase